jgi:hypothetical protein
MNYTNEITNELVAEFGSSILSKNNPIPANALTLRECQILLNKYGFEKAQVIAKRWASLHKVAK